MTGQLPNDIVLCIIVFVFKLQNTVRTGTKSTTQTTGERRRRVLMQCSTSAPDGGYTTAAEAPLETENRENRHLLCSSNRNKDDNTTIDK